jgi:long-chain acyl-CoA synthetase
MVSGSAPLTQEVQGYMKAIMCCPLIEGYGQTENTAAAFTQDENDPNLGHVGGVLAGLEFRLADIP